MTTSASNVPGRSSSEEPRVRRRRRATRPATQPAASPSAETPRTVASRFIILALCLAVILSALAFGTVHSWSLAIFHAGAGFVLVAWAADAWRTRRLRLSRNPLQLPLLGLVAVGVAQLLPLGATPANDAALGAAAARALSLDPFTTRLVVVQIASLVVYFAAALAFVDSPRRLRLLARVLMIFGFALAIFSMAQFFVSPDKIFGVRETTQSLGFGPFINRHHFAGYMELALALPLGFLFGGAVERDKRFIYAFLSMIMALGIVLTNSRGGILSLAAEIMFVLIVSAGIRRGGAEEGGEREGRGVRLRRVAARAVLGFVLIVAFFLGAIFFGGEGALSRFVGTVNADDPTTGRVEFWRATAHMIRDHPVTGVGLGAFGVAYSRYDQGNGRVYRLEQAHNDYLQIVSDAGVAGALLALAFVALLFRAGFRRMDSRDAQRRGVALGALTGCFAVLVHSFFDFTLHTTANALLFLMLAALATLGSRVEQPTRKRRRKTADLPREFDAGAASPRETGADAHAPAAAARVPDPSSPLVMAEPAPATPKEPAAGVSGDAQDILDLGA
ncbi:MAG: O-antigen ligase family protein [Acidobacteria bacterium]|nr:O-antigen ligase family protein [Acidobacteriota bacterium]MCA1642319.1 O-antigen ligase family protein [Acidobacteriota bacterium]